jgi:hypothetical protein
MFLSVNLRLRPGLAEGRQVLARVAIQHQLVVNHGVGVTRVSFVGRKLALGCGIRKFCRPIDFVFFFAKNRIIILY